MPKTILVLGATGNQGTVSLKRSPHFRTVETYPVHGTAGGSVAKLLLQHPNEYKVRAVTRNPDSEASRKLAELGAEVVRGDLTDASTLDAAFKGCWGAFVVTNFYDSVSGPSYLARCISFWGRL